MWNPQSSPKLPRAPSQGSPRLSNARTAEHVAIRGIRVPYCKFICKCGIQLDELKLEYSELVYMPLSLGNRHHLRIDHHHFHSCRYFKLSATAGERPAVAQQPLESQIGQLYSSIDPKLT